MIQVHFRKSPTGAPYYLGYSQGDTGFVTPQMAEQLEADGMIDPIVPLDRGVAPTSWSNAPGDEEETDKRVDLTTEAGVQAHFGNDVESMRDYCRQAGIKVSKSIKRPETLWAKIAKARK